MIDAICLPRNVLAALLGRMTPLADARSTIPVMRCVKIEWGDDELTVATSNSIAWVTETKVVSTKGSWRGCIDAERLADIVKSLPKDGVVTLIGKADRLTVATDGIEARFSARTAEDFPVTTPRGPAMGISDLPASPLATALKFALTAAPPVKVRPSLCGVHIDPAGLAVATDGYRLALHRLPPFGAMPQHGALIPVPTIELLIALLRSAEVVTLSVTAHTVTVTGKQSAHDWTLTSKLVDGTFPAWRRGVPPRVKCPVTVECAALRAAVQRVAEIGDQETSAMKLLLADGRLTVTGSSSDATAVVRTELAVTGGPPQARAAYNAKYMLAALGVITADLIDLHLADESTPVWISPAGEAEGGTVIMPYRANWE